MRVMGFFLVLSPRHCPYIAVVCVDSQGMKGMLKHLIDINSAINDQLCL